MPLQQKEKEIIKKLTGFVGHATNGEPIKFSAERMGDGTADARFADARRTHKANDLPRHFALEMTHGDEL